MNIQYDSSSDSKYVQIRKGKIDSTKKEFDWLMLDYTHEGEIIGVEILDASKHPISITTIGDRLLELSVVVAPKSESDIAYNEVNSDDSNKIFAMKPDFAEAA